MASVPADFVVAGRGGHTHFVAYISRLNIDHEFLFRLLLRGGRGARKGLGSAGFGWVVNEVIVRDAALS